MGYFRLGLRLQDRCHFESVGYEICMRGVIIRLSVNIPISCLACHCHFDKCDVPETKGRGPLRLSVGTLSYIVC